MLAIRKVLALKSGDETEHKIAVDKLAVHLARLESTAGNYADAIRWFQAAQMVSPDPGALQQQIDEIQKKMAAQSSPANSQPH